ncbi:hypothetical protein RclHR1_03860013 [Rhizophagus clarus]|uniref:Uncharacterized protein n=1 Tax=Rhizophagus clarus TaxID=94130 RepID=A0A2Z6RD40_9GLOM|nr:hypothetical protein RclHR1_03860013 [Rhizophagus clarus]
MSLSGCFSVTGVVLIQLILTLGNVLMFSFFNFLEREFLYSGHILTLGNGFGILDCLGHGINVLYRPFIESIRNLLSEHDSNIIPDSTRQNAITMLCSLIRFDMSDRFPMENDLLLE